MCCQQTSDCLCTLSNVRSSYARRHVCCYEYLCGKVIEANAVMFAFRCLLLPFEKCAPWGKVSSWLCSASQEYMALASLKKTKKQMTLLQIWIGGNGINSVKLWWIVSLFVTAPSHRNILGGGDTFKKQCSGSNPTTIWKTKDHTSWMYWGKNKKLKNKVSGFPNSSEKNVLWSDY